MMKKRLFYLLFIGLFSSSVFFICTPVQAESEMDIITDNGEEPPLIEESNNVGFETPSVAGDSQGIQNLNVDLMQDANFFPQDNVKDIIKKSRTILGSDDRKIVDNTTIFPYSAAVFIRMTFPNGGTYIGSGTMISEDTVLTAGHCLYMPKLGGWATSVRVYPGYNQGIAPFGYASKKTLMTVSGWLDKQSEQHDIGAIKLDQPIGKHTGYLGLTTNIQSPITLNGYHGDLGGKLATQTGNIYQSGVYTILYQLDTHGGASGSGLHNAKNQLVGVHAYGSTSYNFGSKMSNDKFNVIQNWIHYTNNVEGKKTGVNYETHVQNRGWMGNVANGSLSGTTNESLQVEALQINLEGMPAGDVEYRVHAYKIGWQGWVKNKQKAGTTGENRRLEAFQVRLTGEVADQYDIVYRAHVQGSGWKAWVKNGEIAGTTGQSRRIEAIQIKLEKK